MVSAVITWYLEERWWTIAQDLGPYSESAPEWANTPWFYLLFFLVVTSIILASAYGFYLYNRSFTTRRLDTQEKILDKRMAHVNEAVAIVEEANEELTWTNDVLQDTNNSLYDANEQLSWTNNQLSDANIALERRTSELRRALENNKEILGVTAHDLKNPLGGILGLTDMLLEDLATLNDVELKKEAVSNLNMIKDSAQGMLSTVTNLLDRHRDGLPVKLNKELSDLNMITHIVVNWNRHQAAKKNIQIQFKPSARPTRVSVDVSAMQRVIDNLLSNAVKYSPPGSKVWVDLVSMQKDVVVSVRDEGPGLSEDDKAKVFGKMARLSARPTGGEHSTGLGLYIVKTLTEEHGGIVGVDSLHGEGSTFWIKIPLIKKDPAHA